MNPAIQRSLGGLGLVRQRTAARILAISPAALISATLIFVLAVFLNAFRHRAAPDLHIDELIYASVGQNLANGHGLSVQGQAFFWQPPLFFLLEWPMIWLGGLGGLNTLDLTLDMRVLNGVIGALTAACLLALGWRLRGPWTGWAMALLFVGDPFVIRVTRRFYLEPFAMLWVLAALWFCYASLDRWTWRRRVLAGVLFGGALLTKEVAFFALFVPVVLWLRREMSWREPLAIIAAAVATYMIYPMWSLTEGLGSQLLDLKLFQYQRLVGIFRYTGFNRPGVSLTQALADNAGDYWTSYVCILLAVPATAYLWFYGDRVGRFLAVWSATTFAYFAALAKFGTLNDQFFYFLMLPVLAVLGYAYAFNLPRVARSLAASWRSRQRAMLVRNTVVLGATLTVALLVLRPNAQIWVTRFGSGTDDGYVKLVAAIQRNVPAGAVIDCPGGSLEELHFVYPNGEYQLLREQRPELLRALGVHWFVLRSKDVYQHDGIDQHVYDYFTSRAKLVWGVDEHTFFKFGLYRIDDLSRLTPDPLIQGTPPTALQLDSKSRARRT